MMLPRRTTKHLTHGISSVYKAHMTLSDWKEKVGIGLAELSRRLLVEYGVQATDETLRRVLTGQTRDPGATLCGALIAISDGDIRMADIGVDPEIVLVRLREIEARGQPKGKTR